MDKPAPKDFQLIINIEAHPWQTFEDCVRRVLNLYRQDHLPLPTHVGCNPEQRKTLPFDYVRYPSPEKVQGAEALGELWERYDTVYFEDNATMQPNQILLAWRE
jgi:hypothetical protein